MATQAQQQSFLDKVIARSGLETTEEAQRAANVVFRIMRDLMSNKTNQEIKAELQQKAPEAEQEVVDLWQDYNVMVAFFSRISPAQNLHIKPGVFMLRLKEEGALPENVSPEEVAKAVFSATKEILPQDRNQQVAQLLPDQVRELWNQA